ncbi:MAG: Flagellar assembly protein FliH/Type secretion system HrpE [Actinomycetia bacterium]|jgi:flagellar assembly protein FliH|nr:Flagellar assembly protein FliH/Type secretion system HrpE [Actinomycetes bacterium]
MDDAFAFPVLEGTTVQSTVPREDLVAAARAEADAITEAARVRGHEEGYAAGMAEAQVRLDPVRDALIEARAGIERMADEIVPLVEHRAVELALVLAEKILATSLALDPSLVGSIATGALRRIVARDRIELDVNPEDVELVTAALASDANELSSSRRIDVIAERRVRRGGCVVRTVDGEIDARIEKQLERAAAILRESIAAAA